MTDTTRTTKNRSWVGDGVIGRQCYCIGPEYCKDTTCPLVRRLNEKPNCIVKEK